jgi:hypothetical protein
MRHPVAAVSCVLAAAIVTAAATAPQNPDPSAAVAEPPSLNAVLLAAGRYLAAYERQVAAVVAEEQYVQEVRGRQRRQLRSDLLVLRDPGFGWVEFRDIFDVDGRAVRNRQERLSQLFFKPTGDPFRQARRIVEEGSRFNLNPDQFRLERTINTPFSALRFLRPTTQNRSAFQLDPRLNEADGLIAVTFEERAMPRIIQTADSAAAQGAFWIDPRTGRVGASLLQVRSRQTTARIRVTFAEDQKLKLWLPKTMDESYETPGGEITGHAEYSNFRQFRVDTTTDIREP